MGAGTLGVLSWAEQAHRRTIAHTMAVVTFSLYALFFSIATRDERRTVFSLDTFSDPTFIIATGVSILTLMLATVFGPLEAFLKTTPLDVRQWLICLAVSLSIVVVTEIRKAVRRSGAANTHNHPGKGDDTPEPLAQDLGTGSNRAGPDGGHASLPAAQDRAMTEKV